jgi:hypothetical protein
MQKGTSGMGFEVLKRLCTSFAQTMEDKIALKMTYKGKERLIFREIRIQKKTVQHVYSPSFFGKLLSNG